MTREGCSAGGNFMVQIGSVDFGGDEPTTTFDTNVVSLNRLMVSKDFFDFQDLSSQT